MKISCGLCGAPFLMTDPIVIRYVASGRQVRAECGCGMIAWIVPIHGTLIVAVLEARRPAVRHA